MRRRCLALIAVAACGADEGAHLTLRAPDGPGDAGSIELVLASPDLVPRVAGQRVSPKQLATEDVTYYLQRTTAGVVAHGVSPVDGFSIDIEPSAEIAETAFIPFLLVYDAGGALSGIGTYQADPTSAQPSTIVVQRGEIDDYTITVEAVQEVDASVAVLTGEALRVSCGRQDGSTFTSGVVWRPQLGPELRLMLPDDPAITDATLRQLDLDCDTHLAVDTTGEDCDDTRAAFHPGAQDACDGEDTNCDGSRYVVIDCTPTTGVCPNPTTGNGFELCDDATGVASMTCQSDPTCLCEQSLPGCTKCQIAHVPVVTAGSITPCQPGIGQLTSPAGCSSGTPCKVEVVAVHGGWDAAVASTSTSGFGRIAFGVVGNFLIEAKRPEGPGAMIPGAGGDVTGEADLVITDSTGAAQLVGVELRLDELASTCPGNGPYPMVCSP